MPDVHTLVGNIGEPLQFEGDVEECDGDRSDDITEHPGPKDENDGVGTASDLERSGVQNGADLDN